MKKEKTKGGALTLNAPMRKEQALEIINGKKVREYRTYNDFWAQRICVVERADDGVLEATAIKPFKRIHFYPYNNSWSLTCEVKAIVLITVNQEFLDEFGSEVSAKIDDKIFVIRLGNVIETTIESDK